MKVITLKFPRNQTKLFTKYSLKSNSGFTFPFNFHRKLGQKIKKSRTFCLSTRKRRRMSEKSNPSQNKYTYKYIQFTAAPSEEKQIKHFVNKENFKTFPNTRFIDPLIQGISPTI